MAELDPERVGEAVVLRQLAAVIGLDAVAGERQRVERAAVAGAIRGLDLVGRDLEAGGVDLDAVMLAGELDQRRIAARRHIRQDGAHHRLHIARRLALGVEKGAKARREVGSARIEADRHGSGSHPPAPDGDQGWFGRPGP